MEADLGPGEHSVVIDGTSLAAGTYLCQLTSTAPDGSRSLKSIRVLLVR